MKRFVTVFGKTSNIHLLKDVGMIPYWLGEKGIFQTSIACLRMEDKYPALSNEVKGLNIEFFEKYFNSVWISELMYIVKNAKRIDILNLYHLNLRSSIQIYVYKKLNKNGFLYLKTDMSNQFLKGKQAHNPIKKKIYFKTISKCDLITAESTELARGLTKYSGRWVDYLSNGYSKYSNTKLYERKNIITTVGRLGAFQKNTEILLDAFIMSNIKDWKLRLIGSTTEEFKQRVDSMIFEKPWLRDRIELTGFISDTHELSKMYAESKVFVLPSRWESFGLVILEALAQGDFLILSDAVSSANDIIKSPKTGSVFMNENTEDLSEKLLSATSNSELFLSESCNQRKLYAENNFLWDVVCDNLAALIKSKSGE